MKFKLMIFLMLFTATIICAQEKSTYTEKFSDLKTPLHHNQWSLIIYRPVNNEPLNSVRCWVKLEDAETGEDVTYTKTKARYEWTSDTKIIHKNDPRSFYSIFKPDNTAKLYDYQRTYYLSGGMAMHLNLKPGKYKITVYTPKDKTNGFKTDNKEDWPSNTFYYDTDNPARVIFVSPTANDNGFYNGGWYIDYKAAKFFKITIPLMEKETEN